MENGYVVLVPRAGLKSCDFIFCATIDEAHEAQRHSSGWSIKIVRGVRFEDKVYVLTSNEMSGWLHDQSGGGLFEV